MIVNAEYALASSRWSDIDRSTFAELRVSATVATYTAGFVGHCGGIGRTREGWVNIGGRWHAEEAGRKDRAERVLHILPFSFEEVMSCSCMY